MSATYEREIFVFGSNTAGIHGAGAARFAVKNHGAIYGQGFGLQGNSYAIPTKDDKIKTLPLDVIAKYVDEFIFYASYHFDWKFKVTAIGTGLAGYTAQQIAPMFRYAPINCVLPETFVRVIHTEHLTWRS
jgi:hypothetical protein